MSALLSLPFKGNAKTRLCGDYNSFDVKLFKVDLDKNLKRLKGTSLRKNLTVNFSDFQNTLRQSSINIIPLRKKFSDLITFLSSPNPSEKLLCIGQIKKHNKKGTDVNWANYKKQRNFCVTLLYFGKLRKTNFNILM